jgi:hypothetical protein
MKWLRLHTEARTDRKLDLLTDQQHRIWFNLLCMAGESSERGIVLFESMDLLAIEVARGDIDALTDTLTALERFRMVQNSEGQVAFTHWQERQYDNPSDRPESTRDRKHIQIQRQIQRINRTEQRQIMARKLRQRQDASAFRFPLIGNRTKTA